MELKEIILTKEWCKKHRNEKFFIVVDKNSWLMAHCIIENNTLSIMIDCAENLYLDRYRTFKIGEFINDYGYFKTFYLKF